MAGEDIIMMTQGELKKLHIVKKAIDKAITQADAARIVEITTRQVRRIIKRIRLQGDKGIIHKSRGRPSNRALPERIKDKALKFQAMETVSGPIGKLFPGQSGQWGSLLAKSCCFSGR